MTFYEFFAGGGMARLGLGHEWTCVFANEWCEKKARAYRAQFGDGELRVCDVASLRVSDLPGHADLAWASFPCQDLSLAGNGAGLGGKRSGTFWEFWRLICGLGSRAPKLIVLENVTGLLTSHQGGDFRAIVRALADAGYRTGALAIDAVYFVPQSRPRLFVVGYRGSEIPAKCVQSEPSVRWHPPRLVAACESTREPMVWWRLPLPPARVIGLRDVLEEKPAGVGWHTREQTNHILHLMSRGHRDKVREAMARAERVVGTVYRRTRDRQRAEVRFDDVAGCLRTPAGGSSRQTILVVEGPTVRSRLLSAREAARLMGVPEDYELPANYTGAYHLFGDGVVVPVVQWLSGDLLRRVAVAAGMAAGLGARRTSAQS